MITPLIKSLKDRIRGEAAEWAKGKIQRQRRDVQTNKTTNGFGPGE